MDNEFRLEVYLKEKRESVNDTLFKVLSLYDTNRELISAMQYSLMANGKRLRPILCISAAECIKNSTNVLIPACAIEMIHTYSLIHDDLPAMDDDDLRRGNPTLHKKYSESTAILAGDALLTHAFYILSNPGVFEFKPLDNNIIIKLISIISESAGTNGMIEGQILDMQAENPLHGIEPLDYLLKMHGLKTGKMIKASVEMGAVAAGANSAQLNNLISYAENIGMAFQIIDDILDIEGDSATLGKPVGSDVNNKKLTFPDVLGIEESREYAENLISTAVKALDIFGEKALPLKKIANYIIKRDY
jgi:geranylgeranyl diphosphate synthase, type II